MICTSNKLGWQTDDDCVKKRCQTLWSIRNWESQKPTRPTVQQVECADCEVGMLIHYDIQVFDPEGYQCDDVPPATVFDPTQLDTDQWTQTAKPQARSTLSWFQAWERI